MEELERRSSEETLTAAKHSVIVILDDIRSMHNVGSVFRTCDAFSVEAIYLCGFTPTPPHRDIHKTALGATESVLWKYFATTNEAVKAAKEKGYNVYAVEQVHDSFPLHSNSFEKKNIALIFGNEVAGVNKDVLKEVNGCIEIPQWGTKHSLNVSVSAGIVLWEMVRNSEEK